jgi:hypothetical protein
MFSISVIDYVGKIRNGVAILLSLNVDDNLYELIFWIDRQKNYTLTVENKLLTLLDVKDIYEYAYINELIAKIFKSIPPINKIFQEFGV